MAETRARVRAGWSHQPGQDLELTVGDFVPAEAADEVGADPIILLKLVAGQQLNRTAGHARDISHWQAEDRLARLYVLLVDRKVVDDYGQAARQCFLWHYAPLLDVARKQAYLAPLEERVFRSIVYRSHERDLVLKPAFGYQRGEPHSVGRIAASDHHELRGRQFLDDDVPYPDQVEYALLGVVPSHEDGVEILCCRIISTRNRLRVEAYAVDDYPRTHAVGGKLAGQVLRYNNHRIRPVVEPGERLPYHRGKDIQVCAARNEVGEEDVLCNDSRQQSRDLLRARDKNRVEAVSGRAKPHTRRGHQHGG